MLFLILGSLLAQAGFAGDYSLKELKRHAHYLAGLSQYGPNLKPTEEDKAIVEEFKALVNTYDSIRTEYEKIDKSDERAQRAFIKEKFDLDQVQLPSRDKAFRFENFYWSHFYKEDKEQRPAKIRFKDPQDVVRKGKEARRRPLNSPQAEHPCFNNKEVKILHPKWCDDCLNALNRTLLIYDTEDWENKREALKSNPKLEAETGKKFMVWEACAEFLYQIEQKKFEKY